MGASFRLQPLEAALLTAFERDAFMTAALLVYLEASGAKDLE